MGEMAELFLASQDDIDFYEDCAGEGYSVPAWATRMPTFNRGPEECFTPNRTQSTARRAYGLEERVCPQGCWMDKNGEVHEICKMTDRYLHNLIQFLEKNRLLLVQNLPAFERMIEERQRRMNGANGR